MRIFGLDITRAKAPAGLTPPAGTQGNGWFPVVREPYTGAWQENMEITAESALAHFAVFGCVTLIATDIGKLALRLVAIDDNGIWTETTNSAYSPVLRKPNRYQTIVKFLEQWITSKLTAGNTYVLKQRDERGVVSALYVLDPSRVTPMIAPDGAVYYELKRNDLVGLDTRDEGTPVIVPAREIIHDQMVTLFHPLVGVTPLFACGMAAKHGLTMQAQSELFFRTGSKPGGVLTAPGEIKQEQAEQMKKRWEEAYSGGNVGRVAVLQQGLKYEPFTVSAVDSQLIQQFNLSARQICTAYHVPPALLDLDEAPSNDIEALWVKYHSQCLQSLMTNLETKLDEGLELKAPYGTEFDIDDLIWMVTSTKTKAAAEAIGAGALSPDEARKKWFGLGTVKGGDTPYMQQQNSLAALAARDADQPFAKPAPAAPAVPGPTPLPAVDDDAEEKHFLITLEKSVEDLHAA